MEKLFDNAFVFLQEHDLDSSCVNYGICEEYRYSRLTKQELVNKIKDYNYYLDNRDSKYSDEVLYCLRQRRGYDKFDYNHDEEFNDWTNDEVFEAVVGWNGLLGSYHQTIKNWVEEIYKVELK